MTSRLMLLIVMIIVSCSSDAGSQTESGKDIQNTIFTKFTADGRELPTLEEFKKTHRPHSQTNGLDTENMRTLMNDYSCACDVTDGVEMRLSMKYDKKSKLQWWNVVLDYSDVPNNENWAVEYAKSIEKSMGKPSFTDVMDDGQEVWVYEYNWGRIIIKYMVNESYIYYTLYRR